MGLFSFCFRVASDECFIGKKEKKIKGVMMVDSLDSGETPLRLSPKNYEHKKKC